MQTDIPFVSEFFIDLTAAVLCKEGQASRRVLLCLLLGHSILDLARVHTGEGSNSAYLSLGSTTCTPQGTQENGRPPRSYWEVIPHSLLSLNVKRFSSPPGFR